MRLRLAKPNVKTTALSAAIQPVSSNVNNNMLHEVNNERLREIENEDIRDETLVLKINKLTHLNEKLTMKEAGTSRSI